MTAATHYSTRATAGFPRPSVGLGTQMNVSVGVIEIAAGDLMEASDIFHMLWLPAGAVVTGGVLYGDDLDTGTETLDFDIGTYVAATEVADDTDRFGNLGVTGLDGDAITGFKVVAGILIPLQGTLMASGPQLMASDMFVSLTVVAAANATGTGTLSLEVRWFYDPNYTV